MKRVKRMYRPGDKVKKITINKQTKKTSFVVQYADGHKAETPYVEIQGSATLYLDPDTKEPIIRTEANISLSQTVSTCTVCGGDLDDQHAHA